MILCLPSQIINIINYNFIIKVNYIMNQSNHTIKEQGVNNNSSKSLIGKKFAKLYRWFFYESESDNDTVLDSTILSATILLIAIGIVMVYSASIAYAFNDPLIHNQYYYLIRHLLYVVIALVSAVLVFNIPTNFWYTHAKTIAIIVLVLLILVLIPHIGKMHNGAKRWLGFGLLSLQPSELAKLAVVIYLAQYLCDKQLKLEKFWQDLTPVLLVIAVCMLLLLLEPDMGSATVIFIVSLSMLYMAELDARLIIGLTVIGIIGFVLLVLVEPYRIRRVLGFMDPWQDALGKGYQLTHSLLAIGHGGWFGVGLGNSIEKLFYLPEAHTDFILAIIAEETGVLGIFIIMLLFWLIFYRGFTVIANTCKKLNRKFQALLSQGISVWLFAQALVNFGVTIGILPTKGLTLPFISYGGSSILITSIALSILLKIDYENKQIYHI